MVDCSVEQKVDLWGVNLVVKKAAYSVDYSVDLKVVLTEFRSADWTAGSRAVCWVDQMDDYWAVQKVSQKAALLANH